MSRRLTTRDKDGVVRRARRKAGAVVRAMLDTLACKEECCDCFYVASPCAGDPAAPCDPPPDMLVYVPCSFFAGVPDPTGAVFRYGLLCWRVFGRASPPDGAKILYEDTDVIEFVADCSECVGLTRWWIIGELCKGPPSTDTVPVIEVDLCRGLMPLTECALVSFASNQSPTWELGARCWLFDPTHISPSRPSNGDDVEGWFVELLYHFPDCCHCLDTIGSPDCFFRTSTIEGQDYECCCAGVIGAEIVAFEYVNEFSLEEDFPPSECEPPQDGYYHDITVRRTTVTLSPAPEDPYRVIVSVSQRARRDYYDGRPPSIHDYDQDSFTSITDFLGGFPLGLATCPPVPPTFNIPCDPRGTRQEELQLSCDQGLRTLSCSYTGTEQDICGTVRRTNNSTAFVMTRQVVDPNAGGCGGGCGQSVSLLQRFLRRRGRRRKGKTRQTPPATGCAGCGGGLRGDEV